MSLSRTLKTLLGATFAVSRLLCTWPAVAEESERAKEGLPQFDVSLFPEQLFWLAVTFGLLYVMMAFVGLPKVKRTQENRQELIASELAAASAANEAAKATIAQYEKALTDARAKAQATVAAITAEATKQSAERQHAQQSQLNQRLHEAEIKIRATRDAALKDIKGSAGDLASAVIEKVSGLKMQVKA